MEYESDDVISLDVPLMIRLLEYAREDAETDAVLHFVAENLVNLSRSGTILTVDHYEELLNF